MRWWLWRVLLGVAVLVGNGVWADTIYLKDGRVLEGRVLIESDDRVVFQSNDASSQRTTLTRAQIDRIVRSAVATPRPTAPATRPGITPGPQVTAPATRPAVVVQPQPATPATPMNPTVPPPPVAARPGAPRTVAQIAADPAAYTWHTYYAQLLEHYRAAMWDGYRRRDPKWDASVRTLLDEEAIVLTAEALPAFYKPAGHEPGRLAALAQSILDAGCDDPMARYVCWRQIKAHRDAVFEALGAHIPAGLRSARMTRSAELRPPPTPPVADFDTTAIPPLLAWRIISDLTPPRDRPRPPASLGKGPFASEAQRREELALLQKMAVQPDATREMDEWIRCVLEGRRQIDKAWEARGSGFANTVTEEGWREFKICLEAAARVLDRAQDLQPRLPEAAYERMAVAMGRSDPDLDAWFRKAITAQVDYELAYGKYIYASAPRWGGSFARILEIGAEAAASDRYDTLVPFQYIVAADHIMNDDQQPLNKLELHRQPAIHKTYVEVLGRYIERHKIGSEIDFFRGLLAVHQGANGEFAEARRLLLEAERGIGHIGILDRGLTQEQYDIVMARGTPLAAQFTAAKLLYDKRDHAAAAQALDELLAKLDPADAARPALQRQRLQAGLLADIDAGRPVSLLTHAVDLCRGGPVEVLPDGGLKLPAALPLLLSVDLPVRQSRVEVLLEFALARQVGGPDLHLEFGATSQDPGIDLILPADPAQPVTTYLRSVTRQKAEARETNHLRIAIWDGQIFAELNNTRLDLGATARTRREWTDAPFVLRFRGTLGRMPPVVLRAFSVRKLEEPPAGL